MDFTENDTHALAQTAFAMEIEHTLIFEKMNNLLECRLILENKEVITADDAMYIKMALTETLFSGENFAINNTKEALLLDLQIAEEGLLDRIKRGWARITTAVTRYKTSAELNRKGLAIALKIVNKDSVMRKSKASKSLTAIPVDKYMKYGKILEQVLLDIVGAYKTTSDVDKLDTALDKLVSKHSAYITKTEKGKVQLKGDSFPKKEKGTYESLGYNSISNLIEVAHLNINLNEKMAKAVPLGSKSIYDMTYKLMHSPGKAAEVSNLSRSAESLIRVATLTLGTVAAFFVGGFVPALITYMFGPAFMAGIINSIKNATYWVSPHHEEASAVKVKA